MASCGNSPIQPIPAAANPPRGPAVLAAALLFATPALGAPPVFDSLAAGQPSLFPGQSTVVDARVTDTDPIVSWVWSASAGTVTGSGSTATYTAPSAPATASVTCTVTDATGATASRSVSVTASDVFPERILADGLRAPVRVAVAKSGEVYVVDTGLGGIAVTGLFTPGVHRFLEFPGARSVAADWNDGIAVAGEPGAAVYTSRGEFRFVLDPGTGLGGATDVAADLAARRYAVLWGPAGRVVVHDSTGARLFSFGQNGDLAGQLKGATALAFDAAGNILVGDAGHGNVKAFSGTDGAFLGLTYGRPTGGMGGAASDRFSALSAVGATPAGVVYGVDAFYGRLSGFNADATVRETVGSYGTGVGQFRTPSGIAVSPTFRRIVVASVNSSRLDVFRTDGLGASMPLLAVSTTDVAFGTTSVGTLLAGRQVVLTSAGTAPVSLSGFTPGGDFLVTSNGCGASLAPGRSCAVVLGFRPTAVGARAGSLTIGNDAQVSPQVVTLSGVGVLAPSAVLGIVGSGTFGLQAVGSPSASRSFTITNTGTGASGNVSVSVSGPHAADFRIVTNGCSTPLAAGASCTVFLSFDPAAPGARTASLDVQDDVAPISAVSLPLSGEGQEAGAAAVPAATPFGLLGLVLATAAAGALALGRRSS